MDNNPQPEKKQQVHHNEDKSYIKSKKKWKDFKLNQDLIEALYDDNKPNPTRVQSETLEVTVNPDRKKFNILIRAANGSGKTMAFVVPILNSIQPDIPTAADKKLYSVSYSAKGRPYKRKYSCRRASSSSRPTSSKINSKETSKFFKPTAKTRAQRNSSLPSDEWTRKNTRPETSLSPCPNPL